MVIQQVIAPLFFLFCVCFCFALLCFVLFCFVLFCFVLFCFVLFCFVLYFCACVFVFVFVFVCLFVLCLFCFRGFFGFFFCFCFCFCFVFVFVFCFCFCFCFCFFFLSFYSASFSFIFILFFPLVNNAMLQVCPRFQQFVSFLVFCLFFIQFDPVFLIHYNIIIISPVFVNRWHHFRSKLYYHTVSIFDTLRPFGPIDNITMTSPRSARVTFRDLDSACRAVGEKFVGPSGNPLLCLWYHRSMISKGFYIRRRHLHVVRDPYTSEDI